jgi:dTDP-4-amino-4,6-dideoxygalactose transaminase
MNDITATIGLHQLQFVGDVLRRHRENAEYYRGRFNGLNGLTLLDYRLDRESSYWLFTVRVRERPRFMEQMKKSGIVVSQVHARNDLHTMFTEFQRNLPGLSEFVAEQVSIPVGWWLTEGQRKYIADAAVSFCK